MLPPDQSPMHQLVAIWRTCRLPGRLEVPASRARLFTAAVHEINAHSNSGRDYDPMTDQRFRWATQWLQVADGSRKAIDADTEMLCNLIMNPAPITHKHLAAADHP